MLKAYADADTIKHNNQTRHKKLNQTIWETFIEIYTEYSEY